MFYKYNQNNSGGHFIINDEVTKHVIIEADSAEEANQRAEKIGIYFNGVSCGQDCDCCGDRWSSAWSIDGKPECTISTYCLSMCCSTKNTDKPHVYIYLKNNEKWKICPAD
jgi:hypothetical protein